VYAAILRVTFPPERREEVVRFLDAEVVDSGGADRSAPSADLPG
jgi:hypothetical protein